MVRAKIFGLAGAAALLSTAALAADLPPPLPPPVYRAAVVETGGWYLRGDVGVGIQSFQSFDFHQTNAASGARWPASWNIDQKDISDVGIIGFGLGYAWNNWLRFDVTGEYRTKDKFKAVGSFRGAADSCVDGVGADGVCRDQFDGNHTATVVLANAYIDLGTWWCVTPFIGAGVGAAYHKITGLSDTGFQANGSSAFGITTTDRTQWNLAWAVHAGLAYNVSNNLKLEFSYRYLNMGNIDTAEIICGANGCANPTGGPRAFYTLHNLSSQDFRIGMRWMLQPEAPPPAYPLVRKG